MSDKGDFQPAPWWLTEENDYTKSRSRGVDYTVDSLIGREDYKKYRLTTDSITTVSGTPGTVLI